MARPRLFISSTFYDLRQVRADLEHFIREIGFDPVLHERGSIPYGSEKKLEEYAYQEVGQSDLLVAIVGGRFGSPSIQTPYSISQAELKKALDLGKPVHIFVERSVHSEYSTYTHNKGRSDTEYHYVDNTRVFEFIEELYALPNNNPISTFETSADITTYLRDQWAGLFQRFLQEQRLRQEFSILEGMQSTMTTLNQLVTFLTEERRNKDVAIQDILLSNHPAFEAVRKAIGAPYRLFFSNRSEMVAYLTARTWAPIDEREWDHPQTEEWIHNDNPRQFRVLWVSKAIFDRNGKLKLLTPSEWKSASVRSEVRERAADEAPRDVDPDDIPF